MNLVTSPDTQREKRVPPGQKITERWPVLHYGEVQCLDVAKWAFTISGLVKKEKILTYEEFMSLPRVTVISDIHCVTGWSKLDNTWGE